MLMILIYSQAWPAGRLMCPDAWFSWTHLGPTIIFYSIIYTNKSDGRSARTRTMNFGPKRSFYSKFWMLWPDIARHNLDPPAMSPLLSVSLYINNNNNKQLSRRRSQRQGQCKGFVLTSNPPPLPALLPQSPPIRSLRRRNNELIRPI